MAENGDEEDSSSDEEMEISPEDESTIMNLETQLGANPTVYDTHVQVRGKPLVQKRTLLQRCRVLIDSAVLKYFSCLMLWHGCGVPLLLRCAVCAADQPAAQVQAPREAAAGQAAYA